MRLANLQEGFTRLQMDKKCAVMGSTKEDDEEAIGKLCSPDQCLQSFMQLVWHFWW